MRVTLDLSRLLEEGKLSPAEAEQLSALAAHDTGSFAINILVGFGIVAVSAGAVALVPTPVTALILGLVVFTIGLAFTLQGQEQWSLLAQICFVVGTLMFSGSVLTIGKGALAAMLIVTAALAGASIVARSSLLVAAAVLALGACLGARAGYWHATYMLGIYEPLVTIILFSLLALGTYYLSKSLAADYERLALIAARTSMFMVTFGFWVGSLWGDDLLLIRSLLRGHRNILIKYSAVLDISPLAFVIGWSFVLLGAGIWGVRENRRWVVNVAAVFGAIHFYTQWFERLGAEPLSVLVSGLLMLAFAGDDTVDLRVACRSGGCWAAIPNRRSRPGPVPTFRVLHVLDRDGHSKSIFDPIRYNRTDVAQTHIRTGRIYSVGFIQIGCGSDHGFLLVACLASRAPRDHGISSCAASPQRGRQNNAKDGGLGRADTSVPLAHRDIGRCGLCNLAAQLDGLAREWRLRAACARGLPAALGIFWQRDRAVFTIPCHAAEGCALSSPAAPTRTRPSGWPQSGWRVDGNAIVGASARRDADWDLHQQRRCRRRSVH